MTVRKYRWSRHYESAEEELTDILTRKHIDAERWALVEFAEVEEHSYSYDTTFWCAEGSVTFMVAGKDIPLQTGDALDVPIDTIFKATAGFTGCVCYENKP
jgi:mannose-6-phosphate isomerase-like protein (cupin superfamily)